MIVRACAAKNMPKNFIEQNEQNTEYRPSVRNAVRAIQCVAEELAKLGYEVHVVTLVHLVRVCRSAVRARKA